MRVCFLFVFVCVCVCVCVLYLLVQGMDAGSVSERKKPLSQTQEVEPSLTE